MAFINPSWMLKGKLLVGGVAGAFLLGSVSGGILVRKVMDGTIARKQLHAEQQRTKEYETALNKANNTIDTERSLRELADKSEQRLKLQLAETDSRYSELLEDTSRGLARIPKDTVRYIQTGEKIGDALIDKDPSNSWIRNVWDDSMYDLAFCGEKVAPFNPEACGMRMAGTVQERTDPKGSFP